MIKGSHKNWINGCNALYLIFFKITAYDIVRYTVNNIHSEPWFSDLKVHIFGKMQDELLGL